MCRCCGVESTTRVVIPTPHDRLFRHVVILRRSRTRPSGYRSSYNCSVQQAKRHT